MIAVITHYRFHSQLYCRKLSTKKKVADNTVLIYTTILFYFAFDVTCQSILLNGNVTVTGGHIKRKKIIVVQTNFQDTCKAENENDHSRGPE